ncbi:MAG: NUDIX hydrolase [Candidatus Woesearchaeota archaeon]
MALLLTIHDEDVGFKSKPFSKKKVRAAARAVIFNKNKIAFLHATKYDYHKLPGGGIKPGESIKKALMRECLEEAGCSIKIIEKVGTITEYRSRWSLVQTSHCFLAEVVTEGKPQFTKSEIAEGFKPIWVTPKKALELMEKNKTKAYDGKFMVLRDKTFLKEAILIRNGKQ